MNILIYIQSKHNLIFKILVVLVCALIISIIIPDKQIKGHRVGAFDPVWAYEDLTSDNDFFLKKSQKMSQV